jgi:superfamily I DNA and/or RNA helicase
LIKINEFLNGNTLEKYNIGLTYGVISFYSGQKKLLKESLLELERKYKNENTLEGKIIYEKLRRVKIGSVDEFQGMEFDVVFLSMVRTMPKNIKAITADDKEKAARRLFGHLCLYNRLNVSMSRQKKLLVVVGDHDLLSNDIASEFIPGLVDFYELCKKEGVVLTCK